ncbi:MAG: DUF6468 domain-containing protein [Hyphomicrobiales bacterium]
MTQFTPGLIIEILLVLLLLLTVGYCMTLNRRLGKLRTSQSELRQIVFELGAATQTAESAIRGLKVTTDEAESRLSDSLHKAQLMARELTTLIDGSSRPAIPVPAAAQPAAPEPVAPKPVAPPPVAVPQPVVQQPVAVPPPAVRQEAAAQARDTWRQQTLSKLKNVG